MRALAPGCWTKVLKTQQLLHNRQLKLTATETAKEGVRQQEIRNRKQEIRNKKQEIRNKKQEIRNKK